MAFHASFCSSRSLQAARLRNTSPLMRSSPVIRAPLPLRTRQEQSTHLPGSFHYNDDDLFYRRTSDGCQPPLFGLGIVLPTSVSHPAMLHDGAISVIDKDIIARSCVTHVQAMKPPEFERSNIVHEMPQKPVLHPVDTQDDMSPILPLPPSIDTARRRSEAAELISPTEKILCPAVKRLSTADYVRPPKGTSKDITSNIIRDESGAEELGDLTRSFIDKTPTVDITEPLDHGTIGLSCHSGPLCVNGSVLSHDEGILDKHITNGTLISPCVRPYALQMCSIPIHHSESRGCGTGHPLSGIDQRSTPRTSVRHVRSSVIMRDPMLCTQKRNSVSRQPIEVSSPSMTPSPTSSPQLWILPAGSEHGAESLMRHVPYMQSSSKASRHHSSTVCMQTVKARSSKYGTIWASSPKTRSPIIFDHLVPLTCGDHNALLARTPS